MRARKLTQRWKYHLQKRKRRVRPYPAEHQRVVLFLTRDRAKALCVNDGRNNDGARAPARDILSYRAVAASYKASPTDQVIRFAEPFQSARKASVGRASI